MQHFTKTQGENCLCAQWSWCIITVIHSFWPFLYRLFKSTTTQRHSQLQHGYCIGVSRRSAQAAVSEGLAQGPYVGFEPTTLRLKGIDSTNAPPCPTRDLVHNGRISM